MPRPLRLRPAMLAATAALLAACAGGPRPGPLPAGHPARADAPTTPVAAPSGLLAEGPPVAPSGQDSSSGHVHGAPPAADATPGHDHASPPPVQEAPDPHAGHAAAAGSGEAGGESATVYACPMHPDVRADEPGACPICGMALEPVATAPEPDGDGHGHHHDGSDGPEGRR